MAALLSTFRKSNYPQVLLALGLIGGACLLAVIISRSSLDTALMIMAGIIGGSMMLAAFFNARFAFFGGIILGYLIPTIERFSDRAISLDPFNFFFIIVAFAGLVYRKYANSESFWAGMRHPVNYAFLAYFAYLMIEVLNPQSFSPEGVAFYLLYTFHAACIFLIAQHLFRDYKAINNFLTFWIIAAGLCGLYACSQQWLGFFSFEIDWIYLSEKRVDIYRLDDGSLRKFGTMTDPAAFGILMAVSSLLTMVMILRSTLKINKLVLYAALFFQVSGMIYSGTRTATFALIAGVCLYILMTLDNWKTMLLAVFFSFVLLFILYAPIYGNVTINRLRSTFKLSDDRSFEVRDNNRARVQPFILSHPIGGGPLTTGAAGERYVPNHPMAGFPVDSGLLRTALEYGWIGLSLLCGLYFVMLQQGVHQFFRFRGSLAKGLQIGCVVALFGNIVAQFSQVAVGGLPQSFIYFALIAIIVNVSKLEHQKT